MRTLIFILFLTSIIINSCKRHNPEDPYYPHFKHLNSRLKGEWELVKIVIDGNDSSVYLKIDTVPIISYFKFEPKSKYTSHSGNGFLYIKTKNMKEYPERVGTFRIDDGHTGTKNDTVYALTKLAYSFYEGKIENNYFGFGSSGEEEITSTSNLAPVFKPISYKIFNNFYFLDRRGSFNEYKIMKATNKRLILENKFEFTNIPYIYRNYRLEFRKIKD